MSVKVVQGLINPLNSSAVNKQVQKPESITASANSASPAASTFTSSEAVNVTVKSGKTAARSDKLKDFSEAKDLSKNISDRIKNGDSSLDAHEGLYPSSARPHFS